MKPLPSAPPFDADLASRLSSALAQNLAGPPRTRHRDTEGQPHYTNRLILESSPYLQQHAHNPVNWYPWGDEAFADARRLDCPIFLSIGYATCHWCHVMEEESFEDETIAAFMNGHYVCIKVDREERPDIDAVYMSAVQLLNGQGGWPLSVFLTQDRHPFFGGTYFPPFAGVRGARHGFLDILAELKRLSKEDPQRLAQSARALTSAVAEDMGKGAHPLVVTTEGSRPDLAPIRSAIDHYEGVFDETHGGLRMAPKFPSHLPIRLLLRHHHRTSLPHVLHMAVRTLEAMAQGGIYDQLAGGFHRYATDVAWLIPHFEKMLYDNALLAVTYAEASQATGRTDFARVAQETCDELLRTFAAPSGGFYSATDADSEGEEGRFFVWSEAEIRQVLGQSPDTDLFLRHYGVTPAGNFEGKSILYVPVPDEDVTLRLGPARKRLLAVRDRRIPPLRDEKILAAWNGLALSAFATVGRILKRREYLDQALATATFLLGKMTHPTRHTVYRSLRGEVTGVMGFLSDHAFVAAGLLDLFDATSDPRWLDEAEALARITRDHFYDPETCGYFMSSRSHEQLLARERPVFDGAEPSGSAVAWENTVRLYAYTQKEEWKSLATQGLAFYESIFRAHPTGVSHALGVLDYLAGPLAEIVLALPEGVDHSPLHQVLQGAFLPRSVVVAGDPNSPNWVALSERIPWVKDKQARKGNATAFVCREGHCALPTTDPKVFKEQLQ